MLFTFVMCVLYVAAIVFTMRKMNTLSMITAGCEALMLFLQIVAFILVIVIVAGKPVEGIDIVYQIFPPGENYIPSKSDRYLYRPDASYNTLAWALFICMLLLIVINIFGLLATIYNLAYRRYYEEDQIVIRG
ncbi:unnamed protein product [Bursaphelenchus xylophilus]|uniref:(pine wood nematode) hypothetical protein n=1 Tax=Bursaphelenchus xylophilus TaxID=6326 RepID=A0A811M8W5_BURXY|nr:unnamed protein product [Bursaphelenchus xylophilus]CAG9132033.1 unnamed protein product [Bursaphelenchus xylophilus]